MVARLLTIWQVDVTVLEMHVRNPVEKVGDDIQAGPVGAEKCRPFVLNWGDAVPMLPASRRSLLETSRIRSTSDGIEKAS